MEEEDEDESVVNCWLIFVLEFVEIWREVRGNERENESFTWWLLGFDEKQVKKKRDKRRSMNSETEENRAMKNRGKQNTRVFSFLVLVLCFCFFKLYLEDWEYEIVNEVSGKVWFEAKGLYLYTKINLNGDVKRTKGNNIWEPQNEDALYLVELVYLMAFLLKNSESIFYISYLIVHNDNDNDIVMVIAR